MVIATDGERQCGSCTLCCKMLYVPDYDSKIGEYCKHCLPNTGCSIHETKKEICRTFDCLWIKQPQIPDSYRPDKCHVLFEMVPHSLVYWGHIDPEHGDADKTDHIQQIIKKINQAGHAVVMSNGGFYLPDGMSQRQLMNDLNHAYRENSKQGTVQVN